MIGWLQRRWGKVCAQSIGDEVFWTMAVDHAAIRCALDPLIARYACGRVLDAGAGRLAWEAVLQPYAGSYLAADYSPSHPGLAFQCDLQGGIPLSDGSVDTIFCCSVLEHVPEPWRVLPEFRRLLSADGHIVLSVPFLYYLHGAPDDFFRFTPYGIRRLAETAGLEVIECSTSGGLAHILLHAISMITSCLLWSARWPELAGGVTRGLHAVARLIDSLDHGGIFAQSVNVVLRRSSEPPIKG